MFKRTHLMAIGMMALGGLLGYAAASAQLPLLLEEGSRGR
jgi:hypothetical protein